MKQLLSTEAHVRGELAGQVEVDHYVAVSFRADIQTHSICHVMLGTGAQSLLELKVDSATTAIAGLVLTLFDREHSPKAPTTAELAYGLPKLPQIENSTGLEHAKRLDTEISFSLGYGKDFIEVDFGDIETAVRILRCDRLDFYLSADKLVGFRAAGLTKDEVSIVRAQRLP